MYIYRKLKFLPLSYNEEIVNGINEYLGKGYEIEDIIDANDGYYILLALKGNGSCKNVGKYILPNSDKNLIEESNEKWIKTSTLDVN